MLVGLLVLVPGPGRADEHLPLQETPTRGLYQPGTGVADGPEPAAVTRNPASLGELSGLVLGLRHTELWGSGPFQSRGTGIYGAAPLPLVRRLQVGAALEVLRPESGAHANLTLALAALPVRALSLGLGYHHVFGGAHGGTDALSLGLRARLGARAALGLSADDLVTGNGAARLQRTYEAELLLRPLADDRLELGLSARVGEARRDLLPAVRLWVRPVRGVGLGAEAAVLTQPDAAGPVAVRASLGLLLDTSHVGGSLFGAVGTAPDQGLATGGAAVAVRASWVRYPGLQVARRLRLLRLEPGKAEGVAFLRLLHLLRELERDPGYGGVVLVLSGFKAGWGRADELRDQLLRLRRAGRRVYVYGAELSARAYYVATAAERIFLDPIGTLRVGGVTITAWNVKEALDLLGVRADLVRIGDYKATPETFTRSEPSPPAREQREAIVRAQHERLRQAIAAARRLPPERARLLIDRGLFTPAAAQAAGLIDAVATGEEVEAALARDLGARPDIVPLPGTPRRFRSWAPRAIAVLSVEGDLVEGESRTIPLVDIRLAGARTLLSALLRAAQDPAVRAIVVRVESPGGSVLVADLLARQIQLIAERKPVVCSFGDLAASGGYYLAAPCQEIFATLSTVTGSIGIFGGKVDASGLLQRLGVRPTTYAAGAHADMDQHFRPYTEEERGLVTEQLRAAYDRFVDIVARGRRLSREQVDAVGRGRVWSGERARALRLIDHHGGLMDAVAAARRRAGIGDREEIEVRFYPEKDPSVLGQLLAALDLRLPGVAGLLRGLPAALLLGETGRLARLEGEIPE